MKRSKKYRSSRRPDRKKQLFLAGLLLVSLGGIVYGLDALNIINLPFRSDEQTTTDSGINYGPPTEEEIKETEAFKENLENSPPANAPSQPSNGQKATVSPMITAWGQNPTTQNVEVGGYVTGVLEEGGNCKVTLELNGKRVEASKTAIANAQSISCGFIEVSRDQLSPGTWSATLSYSSAKYEGTSSSVAVEVK